MSPLNFFLDDFFLGGVHGSNPKPCTYYALSLATELSSWKLSSLIIKERMNFIYKKWKERKDWSCVYHFPVKWDILTKAFTVKYFYDRYIWISKVEVAFDNNLLRYLLIWWTNIEQVSECLLLETGGMSLHDGRILFS